MASPALLRNVAVLGHLHSGKTSFVDVLVEHTLSDKWDPATSVRYTDARADEQQRGVSIKATPVSLALPDSTGKSFLVTVLDTPGHVNFSDEVTASLRAVDGAVVVVDAVEGVMLNTERLVKHALQERLPLVLVVAKLDRLILELKLPPTDAYFKILHTIQEVNALIAAHSPPGQAPHPELSPAAGNVIFSAAAQGWSFSLESYARMYCARWAGGTVDPIAFSKRLWGDLYFDPVRTNGGALTASRRLTLFDPHAGYEEVSAVSYGTWCPAQLCTVRPRASLQGLQPGPGWRGRRAVCDTGTAWRQLGPSPAPDGPEASSQARVPPAPRHTQRVCRHVRATHPVTPGRCRREGPQLLHRTAR